jgi:hypothetical protein
MDKNFEIENDLEILATIMASKYPKNDSKVKEVNKESTLDTFSVDDESNTDSDDNPDECDREIWICDEWLEEIKEYKLKNKENTI